MQVEQPIKIAWRKQELQFVTAIAIIILIGRLFEIYSHHSTFREPFDSTNTDFNLYRNVILPERGSGLVMYLTYLFLSLRTFPAVIKLKSGNVKSHVSVWIPVLIAFVLLGISFNIKEYFLHQWQFNYEGFSIFFNEHNPRSQMSLSVNFFAAFVMVFGYMFYVASRELIIYLIVRSKQPALNISIANKVTAFAFISMGIYIFLIFFGLAQQVSFFAKSFLLFSGFFASFISNIYWIFPANGNGSLFSKKVLFKLLPTSFVYAAPLSMFIHEDRFAILYSWLLQLLLITPLTWIYYQYNKERILKLKVVETALNRSKADLQFLRSQINPHFLFNTLNTLYGTALQENAAKTSEGIQMLGDMMRFMLHENNSDLIGMDKEIGYLQNYIALQKLRTHVSDSIRITDNIGEQECHHQIAPMLLIPFVENAFKHGISLNEPSWIKIQLNCTDREIVFKVSNSRHDFQQNNMDDRQSGVGLKNVEERLKLLYPRKHTLNVHQTEKQFDVDLSITL